MIGFNGSGGVRRRFAIVSVALALAVTAALSLATANESALAQTDSESALPDQVVIFVIDLSGSMNEPFDDERTKLDVAKEAFVEAFTNVSPDAFVGVRVYGDQLAARAPAQREQNCTEDSRLVVPISQLDRDALIAEVQNFEGIGDTPIGLALRQANSDIPDGTIGTVVLFSDGRDECFDADLDGDATVGPSWGEDPCLVAQDIAGEGVDLRIDRVETVGFRADEAAELELRCIADSTGGSYTPIESPEDARDLLPELLAQIFSPREAERLGGVPIEGTPSQDGAPAFSRLDPGEPEDGRFTDMIEMNTEKWYRIAEYGPGGGTFTATLFGLPAQEGISFTMRAYVPSIDETFHDGGDDNAGIPRRPTASIRCPGCSISVNGNDVNEVFWILSLQTDNPSLGGAYDLEILTEGSAFGGVSTSCTEPQECWYEQEIDGRSVERDELQAEYDALVAENVPQELIDQRDALTDEAETAEAAAEETHSKAAGLEEEAAALGDRGSNFLIPLILAAIGVLLGGIAISRRRPLAVDDGVETAETPQTEVIGHVSHESAAVTQAQESTNQESTTETKDRSTRNVEGQPSVPDLESDAPTVPAADPKSEEPTVPTDDLERERPTAATPETERRTVLPDDMEGDPPSAAATETEQASPLEEPEPGWYDDPDDETRLRWWNGESWTDNYQPRSNG